MMYQQYIKNNILDALIYRLDILDERKIMIELEKKMKGEKRNGIKKTTRQKKKKQP
jgi:hypothetical protein